MAEALRPMSTSELLDRTFTLYRRNFLLFAGIASIGPAAYLLFQLMLVGAAGMPAGRTPARTAWAGASIGIGFVVGALVMLAGMALSQAATVKAVAAVHLGRETTIGGAYRSLKGRIPRILGIFFTVTLLIVGGGIVLLALASLITVLAVGGGMKAGTGFGIAGGIVGLVVIVAAAIGAVTIFVRYSLAVQACVVEDLKIRPSLKRSAFLSKGSRSRILTVYTVFVVLSWIVAFGLVMLTSMLAAITGPGIPALIATYLASFLSGVLTGPLATIGMSLVYYDERVRKEAFDLQLIMAGLDTPAAAPAAAPASAGLQ
ncbi:MAG: hypothetical protein LAN83_00095 [Acidobacteriia bacterium]|nr:hypothetical protein [Terriglobia bacterium]